MRWLLLFVAGGAILPDSAIGAAPPPKTGARWPLFVALSTLVMALAGCAAESRGAADPLPRDLRQRVDTLRQEVRTVPTTAGNIAQRADVLWGWGNALALAGMRIPDSLPSEIALSVIFMAVGGEPVGGSGMSIAELGKSFDRYVRELELRESEPEAFGTFTLAQDEPLHARSWATIEIRYTVGSLGMKEGGGFLLGAQGQVDGGAPQIDDPAGDGYTSIESSNSEARFERSSRPLTGLHGGNRAARPTPAFVLEGASLAPGNIVVFRVGDRRGGSRGMQVQTSATDAFLLPIYVDVEGKGQFFAPKWPPLDVVGIDLARLTVFAPSVVGTGEPFDITVRAEDIHLNRATSPIPAWEIVRDGAVVKRVPGGGPALVLVGGLVLDQPGTHRFTVRSADGKLAATSNPVWARKDPAQRVFWGETHGHTSLAEGQGSAESYFRYGIEDARLDFLTLSEHDMWMDDAEWKLLDELTRKTTEEGRAVSFLGYEWTSTRETGGHHNVFFRTPGRRRVPIQKAPRLEQLYAGLEAEPAADVLVIPHAHVAADWNQSDAPIERLVEIASNHGTFEWFGNKYLQNGFKVGFVAAADTHRARPGRTGTRPQTAQTGGLAAALAPAKTPDAIFDALRARATYATSGERILIEAVANGRPPGSELAAGEAPRLGLQVSGTAPIDHIDVVKNGEVVFSRFYLTAPLESRVWVQVSFESSSAVYGWGLDNPRGYRPWEGKLRVEGARVLAVTAPGFVNEYRSSARIDPEDPSVIIFQTETRGRRDVMLVELDGATSSTRFQFAIEAGKERRAAPVLVRPLTDIPATDVTLAFDQMVRGRLEHTLAVDVHTDRILLQTVDPNAPLDRELEWSDLGETEPGDYVYLRVTQLDGGRAWTSPFFFAAAADD